LGKKTHCKTTRRIFQVEESDFIASGIRLPSLEIALPGLIRGGGNDRDHMLAASKSAEMRMLQFFTNSLAPSKPILTPAFSRFFESLKQLHLTI
jgi:hypothetical protein